MKMVLMQNKVDKSKMFVALDLVDNMGCKRKADTFKVKINSARSSEVVKG